MFLALSYKEDLQVQQGLQNLQSEFAAISLRLGFGKCLKQGRQPDALVS